jgi:hypothetical protein
MTTKLEQLLAIFLGTIVVWTSILFLLRYENDEEDADYELTITYDCRAVLSENKDEANKYPEDIKAECRELMHN